MTKRQPRSDSAKFVGGQEITAARDKVTPASINRRNREFWAKASQEFDERARKRPHDVAIAAGIQERRLAALNATLGPDAGTRAISALESLEQIVADLAESHSETNRRKAKSKRPSRRRTTKDEVIAAMRKARTDGQTLPNFLAAAAIGSVEDISIKLKTSASENTYAIDCASADKDSERSASYRTLERWWTSAKQSSAN